MASELYRSTSKQFLKESLNTHLGLVAKTVPIALPARVIYLSVLGPSFFFSGKVQVSSALESLVTAVTGTTQEPQGCRWGVSGAWLRFAGGSAALGTAGGRHNSSTSTPWARAEPTGGWAVSSQSPACSRLLWEIRFHCSFEMLICLSKKGFSFLWKSNTWIYWICVLTVCYTIQYFKLRYVTFMAEVWQSKWPCCTGSWWGWCESGFWNHYPGKLNLHNIEVLPLWMTPFLKLFCWVFLKLTYHCGCQIQKLRVKLSRTSADQIQTTTLALVV